MDTTIAPYIGALQTGVIRSAEALVPWLERISSCPTPCLWLLPELFLGGFDYEHKTYWSEATPDALTHLQTFTRQSGHTLAGTFWEKTTHGYLNSLYICLPHGQAPLKLYSKMHLFPLSEEENHFLPGRPPNSPLTWCNFRIGVGICFDLRFPELFRFQQDGSVHLFLVPAQWPMSRKSHWKALLQARAIENQAYVLGVNGCGPSSLGTLAGASTLFSPWGEECFSLGDTADLASARLDTEALLRARGPFDTHRSSFFIVNKASDEPERG